MGKFTACEDPRVDQRIESHMERIVAAITASMRPLAIVLRGSFGRGEGSVILEEGTVRFLSDYEVDVATYSPFHRSTFAKLTRALSAEFGMQVGVRWTRPDCFLHDRIGPIPLSSVTATISLYEFRYGSRTLYGQDFVSRAPAMDPRQISLESGVRLLLNRMAESLCYMTSDGRSSGDELEAFHWITKTILACAEALLLLWGQYHYSNFERGRRFARLTGDCVRFLPDGGVRLAELVARATEFKLHPARALYPQPAAQTWIGILPVCDAVFRHLMEQVMRIPISHYADFPGNYVHRPLDGLRTPSVAHLVVHKLYELYRAIRSRRLPQSLLSSMSAAEIVYSVVPLVFLTYCDPNAADLLKSARRWLSMLGPMKPQPADVAQEWDYLRQRVVSHWRAFCY